MDTYGAMPIVFVLLWGTGTLLAIVLIQVVATPWKYAIVALPVGLFAGMVASLLRTIDAPDTSVSSR